jgi:phosphatidylglycerol:prolipoprotein diacylglycerol transferase
MLTISIDPVAFTIGSVAVRWYGITLTIAVITALAVPLKEAKRLGVTHDIPGLFLWPIVGGLVGARLVHVIDYWEIYIANPRQIVGLAGLSQNGAAIGVILTMLIYVRVRRVPFSSLASIGDAVAIGAPLAQAIGRVGCTLNGCCYGRPSPFQSFPGAVVYSPPPPGTPVQNWYYLPAEYFGVPLYPAQIYLLLWNLIVFAVAWRFRRRLRPQGSLFFLYLCLYAAGDFGLRFFRVNEPFLLGLHQGQVISLAILVVAVPWLIIRIRQFQKQASAAELVSEAQPEQNREV